MDLLSSYLQSLALIEQKIAHLSAQKFKRYGGFPRLIGRTVSVGHPPRTKSDLRVLLSVRRDLMLQIKEMEGFTNTRALVRNSYIQREVLVDDWAKIQHIKKRIKPESSEEKIRISNQYLSILSEREREAARLIIMEGMSYGKTSEFMGVSRSCVWKYIQRTYNKWDFAKTYMPDDFDAFTFRKKFRGRKNGGDSFDRRNSFSLRAISR